MPIYEFKCKKCKRAKAVIQKFSDKLPSRCSHCKGKLEKQVSINTGFSLKGRGWASDGYQR